MTLTTVSFPMVLSPEESLTQTCSELDEKSSQQSVDCAQANIPPLSPCSPATAASPNEKMKKTIHFWDDSQNKKDQDNANENNKVDDQHELKKDEILSCLNGVCIRPQTKSQHSRRASHNNFDDDEKVVDLWHLRELAISKHGLVSASIRKRVWPKLVGANEHILKASSASLPSHFRSPQVGEVESSNKIKSCKVNDLAESDIVMINKDIDDCIWSIEAEIKAVRRKRDQEKEKEKARNSGFTSLKKGIEDASVASLDSGCSSITAGRITPQLIPETIRAFPRFGAGVSSPHASGASTPVSGIATPNTVPSITPLGVQNISIHENSNVPTVITKVRPKYRRRRKEEQALLLNIITSVLRSVPEKEEPLEPDSDFELDDDTVVVDNINKLYYFKGMHNVIAPLLITLESPSLTSLVFNRLSQSHFRDAMGSTFANIQTGIRLMLMPLLEKVDKGLHDYIVKGGVNDACVFALHWVLCWFTSEVANYDIVCRLFDVFIASHASFPVYLSVAMLTHHSNKNRIMMTLCDESSLVSVISSLPSTIAAETNAMDIFEDMIEVALSYM